MKASELFPAKGASPIAFKHVHKSLDGVCGKCGQYTTNGEQHYCSAPQGFQWGRADRPNAVAHLVPCEPFERVESGAGFQGVTEGQRREMRQAPDRGGLG